MRIFIGVLREMRKVLGKTLFFLSFGTQSTVFSCVRKWDVLFNDTTSEWFILSEACLCHLTPGVFQFSSE